MSQQDEFIIDRCTTPKRPMIGTTHLECLNQSRQLEEVGTNPMVVKMSQTSCMYSFNFETRCNWVFLSPLARLSLLLL